MARYAALLTVTMAGAAPVPEADAADELLVQNPSGPGMRLVDTATSKDLASVPGCRRLSWPPCCGN